MKDALMKSINDAKKAAMVATDAYLKYLETLPKIDAVVALLEGMNCPDELYDCWGMDSHDEVFKIHGVTVGVVSYYGYTDVLGLSKEEFEEVNKRLNMVQE